MIIPIILFWRKNWGALGALWTPGPNGGGWAKPYLPDATPLLLFLIIIIQVIITVLPSC